MFVVQKQQNHTMRNTFRYTSLIFITLIWTTTDAIEKSDENAIKKSDENAIKKSDENAVEKSDEITLPCASCRSRPLRGVEGGNITIHFRINSAMIKDFTVFYVQVILLYFKRHHWLETFIYRHQNNRIFCP